MTSVTVSLDKELVRQAHAEARHAMRYWRGRSCH